MLKAKHILIPANEVHDGGRITWCPSADTVSVTLTYGKYIRTYTAAAFLAVITGEETVKSISARLAKVLIPQD